MSSQNQQPQTLTTFHPFPLLPLHIRQKIFLLAASQPRVVGLHENHIIRPGFCPSNDTILLSSTRPPSLLAVNQESRTIALTLYTRIDSGVSKFVGGCPVYLNKNVDTVYRGRKVVELGCAFMIKCQDYLRRRISIGFGGRKVGVDVEFLRLFGEADELGKLEMISEIRECVRGGVGEIFLVVGNEDDISEMELEPLSSSSSSELSWKERNLIRKTALFRNELKSFWINDPVCKSLNLKCPTLDIRKPKRKGVIEGAFERFERLPVELQDLIWGFAARQRERVVEVKPCEGRKLKLLHGKRDNALVSTCRNSRMIALKVLEMEIVRGLGGDLMLSKGLDVWGLRSIDGRGLNGFMDLGGDRGRRLDGVRVKGGWEGKGVGVRWTGERMPTAREWRVGFGGLERIVMLVGRGRRGCEVEMVEAENVENLSMALWRDVAQAREYVARLLGEMQALEEEERNAEAEAEAAAESEGEEVHVVERKEMNLKIEVKVLRAVSEIWSPYYY